MTIIRDHSIDALYEKACYALMYNAEYESNPRGLRTKEMTNVALVLMNPYKRIVTLPSRKLSLRYLAGELSFYLAESDSLPFIAHYSAFWNKISDDGKTVNSAYGKRIFEEQFRYCLKQLLMDPDTRKAVMVIYDKHDSKTTSKDNPCTMTLQFLVRDNRLNFTVFMRSNDVWLGTPYDIAFFTLVQERMLICLKMHEKFHEVKMGEYTHIVGSFHVYENHWDEARMCANGYGSDPSNAEMPRISLSFELELKDYLFYEEKIREGEKTAPLNFSDPLLQWLAKNIRRTE